MNTFRSWIFAGNVKRCVARGVGEEVAFKNRKLVKMPFLSWVYVLPFDAKDWMKSKSGVRSSFLNGLCFPRGGWGGRQVSTGPRIIHQFGFARVWDPFYCCCAYLKDNVLTNCQTLMSVYFELKESRIPYFRLNLENRG
ncbi:uncharacterized protein TM35_000132060 [Trypanosoma theileri]|uniref:Uncharacterized protein n=1 Tax=Trypanosoma theileri TaxID=67003 RepID=A0A1X0NX00_9TRYP|nr:uncharacterized protein TM35_000132060 [Trypanosoma theileri]ORC89202.1 hypothetical protein TM35_000132060 [Trypanosoma theileri]